MSESQGDSAESGAALLHTPLHSLHQRLGAQMAPFAGHDMPIQYDGGTYPGGILAEHRFTRASAGLFDVSHMGPAILRLATGSGDTEADWRRLAAQIERIVPSDIIGLAPGEMRYTHLLGPDGGVLDDLMVARLPDNDAFIVVNGAVKEADFVLLSVALGANVQIRRLDNPGLGAGTFRPGGVSDLSINSLKMALLALQGPLAEAVLAPLIPGVERLSFLRVDHFGWNHGPAIVSRSGYTGEDGFEILLPAVLAEKFATALLSDARVRPIGLGARDSLRLEAGLCLYGHDLTPARTPVAAGLKWIIQKRRREAADFPGAARILGEIANGPAETLVGLKLLEPGLPREGALVEKDGRAIGSVTSGGFGASLNGDAGAAIALGYVETAFAQPGTRLDILLRNKPRAAEVTALPFLPHRYKRAPRM